MRYFFLNLIVVAVSITITFALFEFTLNAISNKNKIFVTNLSNEELNEKKIKRVGIVNADYFYRVILMPQRTSKSEWNWPGQKDRKVEFFIKGKWNNYGCNDIEFEKSYDAHLFVGDSFVESLQVPHDKTFYKLYRDKVNSELKIYGCGYSGWSPKQIYENLSGRNKNHPSLGDLKLKQVYLFTYIGNDLTDSYNQKVFTNLTNCNKNFDFYTMQLAQAFKEKFISTEYLECIKPMLFAYDVHNKHLEPAIKEYSNYVLKINKVLSERKTDLSIFIIPPLAFYQVKELNFIESSLFQNTIYSQYISRLNEHYFSRYLVELGKINSFNVVDLTPILGKEDYYLSDGHLNEKGHKKISDFMAAN